MERQRNEDGRSSQSLGVGASDIVFRLASYNVERLREHRVEAGNALTFIAKQVVKGECGLETFARMVQLGRFALDNLEAYESLTRAVVDWAEIVDLEPEDLDREKRLVDAMKNLDCCAKRFVAYCENF